MIEIHILYMSNLHHLTRGSFYYGHGKKSPTLSRHVCLQWQKFTSFIWANCIIRQGGHSTTGMVRRPHTIKTSFVLPMIEIHIIYASNSHNKRRGSLYHGLGKTTHTLPRCHVCYPWKKFPSFMWAICIIWQGGHSTTGMVRSPPHTLSRHHVCHQWQKFTSFIWANCIIKGGGHFTTGVVRRPPHFQDIKFVNHDRNSHRLH